MQNVDHARNSGTERHRKSPSGTQSPRISPGAFAARSPPPRGRGMTKRWRDVLQIHPAAELFPLMTPDELHALGEDIKKKGLTSPIVLGRSHPQARAQLLDGRNRLD